MKNVIKKTATILIIVIMLFSLAAPAAASTSQRINVTFGINIWVDGKYFQLVDGNENPVEPFLYNGTTYVPLRAVSSLFNTNIRWNGATKTVALNTENKGQLAHSGRDPYLKSQSTKSIVVQSDVSIQLNGEPFILTNANGVPLPTYIYNGTTYIALRAISLIFNETARWHGSSNTVLLGDASKHVPPPAVSNFEAQVLELTNNERARHGLNALHWDEKTLGVARAHSTDMAKRRYFNHYTPEGISPFDRLTAAGVTYWTAGENIAMGQRSAAIVVNAWMNSPGHRANILTAGFTHIGIGFDNYYWTQVFIGK